MVFARRTHQQLAESETFEMAGVEAAIPGALAASCGADAARKLGQVPSRSLATRFITQIK